LRQEQNEGPGPARDRGIVEATGQWIVTLDDDDELTSGAIDAIRTALREWPPASNYPLIQFPRSNGGIHDRFRVLAIEDYLFQRVWGDFSHVFQRERYLSEQLSFPRTRLGAESILIWRVARCYGIPTWNRQITTIHDDAPDRLTCFRQQVDKAHEFAVLQEMELDAFRDILATRCPDLLCTKHMGAAVYWVLAGQRRRATSHLRVLWQHRWKVRAACVYASGWCPSAVLKWIFLRYRELARWRRVSNSEAVAAMSSASLSSEVPTTREAA
jgi:GalNAc5-diNAcBac-PP-undecaprenol beta-1,3-glucosyltransferase